MDLLNVLTAYMALVYATAIQTAPSDLMVTPVPTETPKIEILETATPEPTPEPTPTFTPGPTAVPLPDFTPNKKYEQLNFKDKGDDVKALQAQLKKFGYYKGEIDGAYGKGTYEAVRLFQKLHSLQADGIAGRATLTLLFEGKNILMLPDENATISTIVPIQIPIASPEPTQEN